MAIIAILLAFAIGFAVGRYQQTYQVQNRGEARLSREIRSSFRPPDYHLLNHITIPCKDGTTQIDHLLISRYGVFVIESKDYKGWIFANEKDRNWTQVLYRAKFRFQNPIRQNYKHVCAVRELLDFLDPCAIHSAVVFTGSATFKTDVPDGVFAVSQFLVHVASHKGEVMSANRVQFCVGRIEASRFAITLETDIDHVDRLRRKHGIHD